MKTIVHCVWVVLALGSGCVGSGEDLIVSGELRVHRRDLNRCMALGGTRAQCLACLSAGITPEQCLAPNQPPVADIGMETLTINRGEHLMFDLLGSYLDSLEPNIVDVTSTADSDGQIVSVCFEGDADFKAQSVALGASDKYCYTRPGRAFGEYAHGLMYVPTRAVPLTFELGPTVSPGQYTVTMTVTDDDGATDTDALALTIQDQPGENHAPVFELPERITVNANDPVAVNFSTYLFEYHGSEATGQIDLSGAYDPDGALYRVTCGYWGSHGGGSSGGLASPDYSQGCNIYNLAAGTYGFYVELSDPFDAKTRVESELVILPSS